MKKIIFLISIVFSSISLYSETIFMKDGDSLQGKITDQNAKSISLQREDGTIKTINKDDISRIQYRDKNSAMDRDADLDNEPKEIFQEKLPPYIPPPPPPIVERPPPERVIKPPEPMEKPITAGGAVLYSTFFPGSGQWQQERKFTGFLYASMFWAGVYLTYNENRYYQNAKRDYNNLNDPYSTENIWRLAFNLEPNTYDERVKGYEKQDPINAFISKELDPYNLQRKAVEGHYNRMVSYGGATVAIYLWNLLDAYLFHPSSSEWGATSSSIPRLQIVTLPKGLDSLHTTGTVVNFQDNNTRIFLEWRF